MNENGQSSTADSSAKNYYNITQFRSDTWSSLKHTADKLAQYPPRKRIPQELRNEVAQLFEALECIEQYWAYPGKEKLDEFARLVDKREFVTFTNAVAEVLRVIVSETYRSKPLTYSPSRNLKKVDKEYSKENEKDLHYFEVLVVDNLSYHEEYEFKRRIVGIRNIKDKFFYEPVVVRTFQDALIAILFNYNIQSIVIRYGFPFKSRNKLSLINAFVTQVLKCHPDDETNQELGPVLGRVIKRFRPELDLFYVTDTSLDNITEDSHQNFRRIFYRQDDMLDLHLSILKGIQERYETPFFKALKKYSQQPTGVFHAMPISRGNSINKSHWIRDMGEFYGRNIFLAETSATTGGLDSLLQPVGPLKKSQQAAARAFGARNTFFVTNGTSTANKVVLQALVHPGDVVLVDRDCHKSHHYGMVLSGALPVYLDSYPIIDYSMYGAVPLQEIKKRLLEFKAAGRLESVKMLLLTNCTFDGLVYNVERVMQEVLAIKPDMIFLWDEAWFGFAGFNRTYRQRTAMAAASKLYNRYQSDSYRQKFNHHKTALEEQGPDAVPMMPDPDLVKIRVYSTQSTHKTLTSLRQGSMIHVWDEDYQKQVEEPFHEAYMTHTSTSPNYQILASLDVGRKQAELEGNEFVEKSIEMAMVLREKIANHLLLKKYFSIVTVEDFIPEDYRFSGLKKYYDPQTGWSAMDEAWERDEFVLDPTKITLYIGRTGVDGDTFKKRFLMDQFGIQVNKTTRNTVLFMTNIGTTRSSVAYLIGVLMRIAKQLDEGISSLSTREREIHKNKVRSLTEELPPLPHFSYFHYVFRPFHETVEGDMRSAFFLAYKKENCGYLKLDECEEEIGKGREVVSSSFVIPYPPGFPVLVPGQVITKEILNFMKALDVTEIHSYRPELGLCVFTEATIDELKSNHKFEGHVSEVKHERQNKAYLKEDTKAAKTTKQNIEK